MTGDERRRARAAAARWGLALALGLAATLALPVGSATAAEPTTIVGVQSGRCLDVTGGSREARTPVNLYDCHGRAHQQWTYTDARELRVFGDSCLDVRGWSDEPGAVAQAYPCHGGANQQWRLREDGTIRSVATDACLDVLDRRTANGAEVAMWPCHGGPNQRWTLGADSGSGGDGGGSDTTAPSSPTGLRTSGLTCDAVRLTWDAARDDTGVVRYDVYRDGQRLTRVDGTRTDADLSLEPGQRWGLYVNAVDAAGNTSRSSDSVVVEPPLCGDDSEPPTRPGTPAATVEGTTVTLSWQASRDDTGVRQYLVERDGREVGRITGTADREPATRFTDAGLAAGTDYSYVVFAVDGHGNRSNPSRTVEVTAGRGCSRMFCGARPVTTDDPAWQCDDGRGGPRDLCEDDMPWGLAELPDGDLLYNRRDSHDLVRLDPSTGERENLGTVPGVSPTDLTNGEGGLMGLALSPDFERDGWVYVMYTEADGTGGTDEVSAVGNVVARIPYRDGALRTGRREVLLRGIRWATWHDGGRLRFGPDGMLYVATGDAEVTRSAQDVDDLNGKILRMTPEGEAPADNPFANPDGPGRSLVYSYGHRNPQGLAFDAQGRLWAQEFGSSQQDETNLIRPGRNYGWPLCEGERPKDGGCDRAADGTALTPPKAVYPTAEASCSGIAVVRGQLFVACLRGERLYGWRIRGDGADASLTDRDTDLQGTFGRLRTVEPSSDGHLWVTTSNDRSSGALDSSERVMKVLLGR